MSHLSPSDAASLDDVLERVVIEPGTMLTSIGAPLDSVYFLETVIASVGVQVADGRHIETGVIGYEGVVGWTAFVGISRATFDAVAQMKEGTALRMSREDARRAGVASSSLLALIAQYADGMAAQMAQGIMSAVRDDLERRLTRWLLMRHDRTVTDQLLFRHEEIGTSLGVRRASVTDALHILEGKRLVRCHRGRIGIRDRVGLERLAGDSYGTAEVEYRDRATAFGQNDAGIGRAEPTILRTWPVTNYACPPSLRDRYSLEGEQNCPTMISR